MSKIVVCTNNIHPIMKRPINLIIGEDYQVVGESKLLYFILNKGVKKGYDKSYFVEV